MSMNFNYFILLSEDRLQETFEKVTVTPAISCGSRFSKEIRSMWSLSVCIPEKGYAVLNLPATSGQMWQQAREY